MNDTDKLKVEVTGSRASILVPSNRAEELHSYLRNRRVLASPPQPCTSGIDSIQLGKGTDVKAVQALLDQFS